MTAQFGEELKYEGTWVRMHCCPPIPCWHPSIMSNKKYERYRSSACWRGYIGTWEIRGGRFYLVDLNGKLYLKGKKGKKNPLFAEWFTGVLRIPKGELVKYVHSGFRSVYEYELQIKIEKGIVTNTRTISNLTFVQKAQRLFRRFIGIFYRNRGIGEKGRETNRRPKRAKKAL